MFLWNPEQFNKHTYDWQLFHFIFLNAFFIRYRNPFVVGTGKYHFIFSNYLLCCLDLLPDRGFVAMLETGL